MYKYAGSGAKTWELGSKGLGSDQLTLIGYSFYSGRGRAIICAANTIILQFFWEAGLSRFVSRNTQVHVSLWVS